MQTFCPCSFKLGDAREASSSEILSLLEQQVEMKRLQKIRQAGCSLPYSECGLPLCLLFGFSINFLSLSTRGLERKYHLGEIMC